jgi:hypothetical protein
MVQWTAEKDQIVRTRTHLSLPHLLTSAQLLKGIFHFCDIKSSAPLLSYLAKQIGTGTSSSLHPFFHSISPTSHATDCTPKAVSHRLTNLRNTGKPLNGTPSKSAVTFKAATTPKTPRSRAKKQKLPSPESDSPEGLQDESDGGLEESPLASKKRKRVTPKKTVDYKETSSEDESVEEEYIPLGSRKHVKTEPVEEMLVFGENAPLEQGEKEI